MAAYERLWDELTAEEVFDLDDSIRLEKRLEELHELGFDAAEIELVKTATGYQLRIPSGSRRGRIPPAAAAQRLTGLDAQENQARRLLADIASYPRVARSARASRRSRTRRSPAAG